MWAGRAQSPCRRGRGEPDATPPVVVDSASTGTIWHGRPEGCVFASCMWRVASCVWRVASCVWRVASCVWLDARCVLQLSAAHTEVQAVVRAVRPASPCPVPPGSGLLVGSGCRNVVRPIGARCLRRVALRQRNDDKQQLRRVDRVRARHVLDQLQSGARHRPIGGGRAAVAATACVWYVRARGLRWRCASIGRSISTAAMAIIGTILVT